MSSINIIPKQVLACIELIEQITMLQSDRNYTNIYFENGKSTLSSRTLLMFESELPRTKFIRINRSYMLNVSLISHYQSSTKTLHLLNGMVFKVSRRRISSIKNWDITIIKASKGKTMHN